MEEIKEFCIATKDFFINAGKGLFYITHPSSLGTLIWNGCVYNSFMICTIICLTSLIIYMCGNKKAKLGVTGSFFVYILIHMLNAIF